MSQGSVLVIYKIYLEGCQIAIAVYVLMQYR